MFANVSTEDAHDVVVKEYIRVLSLDLPLKEDVFLFIGNKMLEDLLHRGNNDPVVDALHMAIVVLYMERADGTDMQRLEVLDFAAHALLEFLSRRPVGSFLSFFRRAR